jgi:hypothetical protein
MSLLLLASTMCFGRTLLRFWNAPNQATAANEPGDAGDRASATL